MSLPDIDTEEGLMARVLIAESLNPGYGSRYNEADVLKAMQMMKAVYDNRLTDPALFGASGADSLADVILAPGQTAGFTRGADGTIQISSSVQARIDRVLSIANDGAPGRYAQFVNNAVGVATGRIPSLDPYKGMSSIGAIPITGGIYGFRTAGSSHPGGRFVQIPAGAGGVISGKQFYALRP